MKPNNKLLLWPACFLFVMMSLVTAGCHNSNGVGSAKRVGGYGSDALNSILVSLDSLRTFPFTSARTDEIKKALLLPTPVLLCRDSLNNDQQLAQIIALNDPAFTRFVKDSSGIPFRNEVFGIYPARQSDFESAAQVPDLKSVYRVEMFNYGLNLTSIALVNIKTSAVSGVNQLPGFQPDIPADLKELAVQIAIHSPEVQKALGYQPDGNAALMAGTKTALNRTRCERSHHLCVAPTFTKDGKALWAIVDLTDLRLVGVRWTTTGTTGPATPMTEKRLQDDKITACFCEVEQPLEKYGWNLKYMLTSSDGLRISDVSFKNKPVMRSAKLVDWHVSYSGTDGFGYSDAVGCPYFSQAAVVAWSLPSVAELKNDRNEIVGFALEQTFRSEGWPTPCNYNYRQRYEFYQDGKFRISGASIGRGCGNDGT